MKIKGQRSLPKEEETFLFSHSPWMRSSCGYRCDSCSDQRKLLGSPVSLYGTDRWAGSRDEKSGQVQCRWRLWCCLSEHTVQHRKEARQRGLWNQPCPVTQYVMSDKLGDHPGPWFFVSETHYIRHPFSIRFIEHGARCWECNGVHTLGGRWE